LWITRNLRSRLIVTRLRWPHEIDSPVGTQYFDLQADGTMFWNDVLTRKNHDRWLVGAGRDGMTDYVDDLGRETPHEPFFGVWRIRKQDPVTSETSEAPK
jgi:hypothetical protein